MNRVAKAFWILLLFALPAWAAPTGITSLPPKEKRWALLIGVDRYEDPDIGLKSGSADAVALRDALRETAGFPGDQVIVLATTEGKDRQPTRRNILAWLSILLTKRVPRDGLFVLAFSGHGIERAREVYLFPSDVHNSDNLRLLQETAVSVGWIRDEIEMNHIAQVVFLVDACRNDPGGKSGNSNRMTKAYRDRFDLGSKVKAFATLFAARENQRAFEYDEKDQGYFTWAVVEGLRGEAANEGGEVTLRSLVDYIEETVPELVARTGNDQTPDSIIGGYRADKLVLATIPGKIASGPVAVTTSVDPKAIELAFWASVEKLNRREGYEEYLRRYPNGIYAYIARMYTASGSADTRAATETAVFSRSAVNKAIATGEYARTRTLLEIGVSTRNAEAQTILGQLLYQCLGGPCDFERARLLFDQASKSGSRDAEGWLSYMTMTSGGDIERAISYARAAADRGELMGRLVLGQAYDRGISVMYDEAAANRWYALAFPELQALLKAGDPFAEYFVGVCYLNGDAGLVRDVAKGIELLKKASDKGYPAAYVRLGYLYRAGEGVTKDDARGIALFRSAAEQDYPGGLAALARVYDDGAPGIPRNPAKALDLFQKAANLGSSSARSSLGFIYGTGKDGVAKDDAKAVAFYRQAADQGDAMAMTNLGYLYANGTHGLAKDPYRAVELYRRALAHGGAGAQNNLGTMYELGVGGLEKDTAKAIDLYRKAAAQGSEAAKENLARLGQK